MLERYETGGIEFDCFKCGKARGIECECIPRGIKLEDLSDDIRNRFEAGIDLCESPIEELFLRALQVQSFGLRGYSFVIGNDPKEWRPGSPVIYCIPQYPLGKYRVDFLLADLKRSTDDVTEALIVECDGHDYHQRTKEQAERDSRQSRYLTSIGARVFRFTGSELYRDPLQAADEVFSYIYAGLP